MSCNRSPMILLLACLCLLCSYSSAVSIVSDGWVQIATPLHPPSGRDSQSAVVNPINNSIVFFGGKDTTNYYNNISIYLLETDTWGVATPTGDLPQGRYGHSAVISVQNLMVVFGGRNDTTYFADILVFDVVTNTWVQKDIVGNPPSPRFGHTAVCDSTTNQMVVFGGYDSESNYLNDVNFFDLTTFTWLPSRQASGDIAPRAFHSAIVSPLNVMVVYGGLASQGTYADTVCYTLATDTWWSCGGTAPGARAYHTAVRSPIHKMVVFGGKDGTNNVNGDVWNFDLYSYTWSQPDPTGIPMNDRYSHCAVCSPFGIMVIFGGIIGDGTESNELGKYNLATTVLRNANDGAVLIVLISLVGTILISLCFAMDYMQEQNAIEKEEAIEQMKEQIAKLMPKIPVGPKTKQFFSDIRVALDPLKDPPK